MIINGKDYREILEKIIKHYGPEHQRMKACEELAELQVEIFHGNKKKIVGELADVYIMLNQIMLINSIGQYEVLQEMGRKLKRTERRMKTEV